MKTDHMHKLKAFFSFLLILWKFHTLNFDHIHVPRSSRSIPTYFAVNSVSYFCIFYKLPDTLCAVHIQFEVWTWLRWSSLQWPHPSRKLFLLSQHLIPANRSRPRSGTSCHFRCLWKNCDLFMPEAVSLRLSLLSRPRTCCQTRPSTPWRNYYHFSPHGHGIIPTPITLDT